MPEPENIQPVCGGDLRHLMLAQKPSTIEGVEKTSGAQDLGRPANNDLQFGEEDAGNPRSPIEMHEFKSPVGLTAFGMPLHFPITSLIDRREPETEWSRTEWPLFLH